MKTEVKQLHPHEVALFCNIYNLDNLDIDSKFISAWNGKYIESIVIVNNSTKKLITKLSSLGRTISSVSYIFHDVYQDYERFYLGDEMLDLDTDKVFTDEELLNHHQKSFAKFISDEKRRDTI